MTACPHCGGIADPSTTCPRSIACPDCGAAAGARCKRPSGHPAAELHAARIAAAASQDARLEAERAFFTLEDERRTSDPGEQLGLLEVAPTSTFADDYGAAPAALNTTTLF